MEIMYGNNVIVEYLSFILVQRKWNTRHHLGVCTSDWEPRTHKFSVSQKSRLKKAYPPLRSKNGNLVSTDEDKAEEFNNIFASVFTTNLSPHPSPVDGLQDGVQGGKAPPTVKEDQVWDHLPNTHPPFCRQTQERNWSCLTNNHLAQ